MNLQFKYFLVRGKINPTLILTTSKDFVWERLCGPGGYCAKIYRTRRGAENAGGTVRPCDKHGVESK